MNLAVEQSAILLTLDKDFGDLVFRHQRLHAGVILLRSAGITATEKAERVGGAIRQHGEEFRGAFSVITSQLVRIRKRL